MMKNLLSKYWLFIIAGIVLMPLIIYVAYAAQSYRSDPGTTITVNEHGVCKTVTNSAGTNDLTSTAYTISGETYQSGYPATAGFDNSATAGFSAVSSASTYIGQDFGAGNTKNIRRVRIHGASYSYGFNAKLQYSDNGSTWSDTNLTAISVPNNNAWSSWMDVNDYGSHQYWRFLDRQTQAYSQAMEIEMVESVIGNSYFIPTNTSAEWEAFRNAAQNISNLSLLDCYFIIDNYASGKSCSTLCNERKAQCISVGLDQNAQDTRFRATIGQRWSSNSCAYMVYSGMYCAYPLNNFVCNRWASSYYMTKCRCLSQ